MSKYNETTRREVMKLFITGEPIERISKQTGVTKTTIYKWREKYKWDERKTTVDKRVQEKVNETLTDIKVRQHRILKGVIGRFVENLQETDRRGRTTLKVNVNELVTALKHELHLFGDAEITVNIDSTVKDAERRLVEFIAKEKSSNDIR
jgi:transposase-like protein